jgi:hypothetical protein
MHNKHVRNSVIFLIVFLYVITARDKLVNALFSIWVGAWAMSKLFKPLLGPHQGFENLTVNDFIPNGAKILGLLFEPTRKRTFFMMIWWTSGVVVGLATYKLLEVLLISP